MSTLSLHTIPYLFPVRPGHRETLEGFTRRIQTKNYETPQHRADLVRAMVTDMPGSTPAEAWHRVLETRTGRPLTLQSETATTTHADGTECAGCATRIGIRYLCRLCARGASIEQAPHIDDFVCLRHQLYVGPGTTPRSQSAATPEEVAAELVAHKLRRTGRLDTALYTTLRDVLDASRTGSKKVESTHRQTFAAIVQLAVITTNTDFRRCFYALNTHYSVSYEFLAEVVVQVPSVNPVALRKNLWFRYRPVFLAIRESLQNGTAYTANSTHELPGPKTMDHEAAEVTGLEPFVNYLSMSPGLRIDDMSWPAILTPSVRAMPSWTESVETICLFGHRTSRTVQSIHRNAKIRKDACRICHHRTLRSGENDLVTTHPRVAATFHPTKNRKTAEEYFAGSVEVVWWLCSEGHEWEASCRKRTANNSDCQLCTYKLIVPGQNDLTTLHGDVAARWDPSNPQNLATISPLSTASVRWRCANGHSYKQAVCDAVDNGTCPICDREIATESNALTIMRPDVAAQLHPTRNTNLDIATLAVTSTKELWWLCAKDHPFISRVDSRVAGIACTVCFPRKAHRGVNDTQTRYPKLSPEWHPYLNGRETPDRVVPGTNLVWWKCFSKGHNLQQTVPHRAASGGCPDCLPADRITAEG